MKEFVSLCPLFKCTKSHLFNKKHAFFNSIGSWIYQILKITSYSIYFILRGRFEKLKMVWRGLLDGIKIKKIKHTI